MSTLRNLVGHTLVLTGVRAFVSGEHENDRVVEMRTVADRWADLQSNWDDVLEVIGA